MLAGTVAAILNIAQSAMKAGRDKVTQSSTGLTRLLESPRVFSTWLDLLGAQKCNAHLVSTYLDLQPGEVVLDVGCGVGNMVEAIPDGVRYVGIDFSGAYVKYANRHRGARGEFLVGDVGAVATLGLLNVDAIILFGVLHHIDDRQATCLFDDFNRVLRPGGRLLTLDPGLHRDNSAFVRSLIAMDRGKDVRDRDGYLAVTKSFAGTVDAMVFHDLIRIPYTHIVLRAVKD